MRGRIIVYIVLFLAINNCIAQNENIPTVLTSLDTFQLDNPQSISQFFKQIETSQNLITVDTLVPLYTKALTAAQQIQDDTLAQNIAYTLGKYYLNNNDYANSSIYNELALNHAKQSGINYYLANAYNQLGIQYLFEGDNINAINHFLQVIEIEGNSNRIKHMQISAFNNLSYCYYLLGETNESIQYLKVVAAEYENLSTPFDAYSLSLAYLGLYECYEDIENQDTAKLYIQKLINSVKKLEGFSNGEILKFEYTISIVYINITTHYLKANKLNNAKEYYEKINAFKYYNPLDKYLLDLKYNISTNNLSIAKKLVDNPLDNIEKNETRATDYYETIAKYYKKTGNYKKSLDYTTLFKDKQIEQLKSQRIKLSSYTKSKIELAESKRDNVTLKKEQDFQKTLSKMAYGLVGLLLGLLGLIFYSYRQIRTKNLYLHKNLEDKKVIELQSKQLQQAEQQKNQLFTNIAHEFQTPLNIIQGLSKELYKKEVLTATDYESLGIIIKNSRNLSKTTNQILATNLDEEHHTSSNSVLFSLSDLFEYILPEFQFLASQKSITLESHSFKNEDISIYSDVGKIETILKNLLSNAIKYTGTNGNISIEYKIDGFGYHQISVSDNGKGIPKEELSAIFDRYHKASTNEKESGFGLGLAICKEYITSLGGEIRVKSEQDVLTIFTIRFPKANDTILKKQTTYYRFPEIIATPNLSSDKNVPNRIAAPLIDLLIVEDNLDFCQFLAQILKKDYHLVFTHNGQQAIDYLENNMPALIITDWMMPGMDGLELVQYLKTTEKYYHFPILMLTAKSLISDKLKALRVGIDDYLIKPIEADVLKNRIKNLLHSLEERQEKAAQFPHIPTKESNLELAIVDQEWLVKVEETIAPLIGDFDLNLEQIALLNKTNVKQLSIKIKKITGLTAKKYIQEIRYWEARKFLETGKHSSVKTIALSVGFKDTKNFSRRFKERFGKYPSEYMLASISK